MAPLPFGGFDRRTAGGRIRVVEVEDVAAVLLPRCVGGSRRAVQTERRQQPVPAAREVPHGRPFAFGRFASLDDPVGQPRRDGLFGREPAAVAVVLGHPLRKLFLRASRPSGVEGGQPFVGLAEQFGAGFQLCGVALCGAGRRVHQVERPCRDFAPSFRCGLCDERRGRGHVAVAAGGHFGVERCDARHRVAELFVGGHAVVGRCELPLFGYADRPLDIDVADVGRISDLNVGFHGYWFSLFR